MPRLRKAFVMEVHAGCEEEYARRHQPIPAELAAVLKTHGVHNYSIFLHPETRQLFAFVELEDEARWEAVAATEACQRWWQHMRPLMPTDPSGRPRSISLSEVFHLD